MRGRRHCAAMRDRIDRAARNEKIVKLAGLGLSYTTIAARMNISSRSVGRIMRSSRNVR